MNKLWKRALVGESRHIRWWNGKVLTWRWIDASRTETICLAWMDLKIISLVTWMKVSFETRTDQIRRDNFFLQVFIFTLKKTLLLTWKVWNFRTEFDVVWSNMQKTKLFISSSSRYVYVANAKTWIQNVNVSLVRKAKSSLLWTLHFVCFRFWILCFTALLESYRHNYLV